jgi:hypothetical protein
MKRSFVRTGSGQTHRETRENNCRFLTHGADGRREVEGPNHDHVDAYGKCQWLSVPYMFVPSLSTQIIIVFFMKTTSQRCSG